MVPPKRGIGQQISKQHRLIKFFHDKIKYEGGFLAGWMQRKCRLSRSLGIGYRIDRSIPSSFARLSSGTVARSIKKGCLYTYYCIARYSTNSLFGYIDVERVGTRLIRVLELASSCCKIFVIVIQGT